MSKKRQYVLLQDPEFDPKPYRRLISWYHDIPGIWGVFSSYCTGCCEPEEGVVFPPEARGAGCHECGYTGRSRTRWFTPLWWLRGLIVRLPEDVALEEVPL